MSKRNPTYKNVSGLFSRRKIKSAIELMPKSATARIHGVQTYKANCLNNKIYGYKSLKTGADNTDFGHVIMGKLEGYNGPIIIKVSDLDIFYNREKMGLSAIEGFNYYAKIICDFTCNDDKERWMKNINKPIKLCVGNQPLNFFIMEYIDDGDLEKNIKKINNNEELCSIFKQIMFCFIELGQKYKIYHGDIHSANILIDRTDDVYSSHIINNEVIKVKTFGKIPKLIDFGRCGKFYNKSPTHEEIIYELMIAVSVCIHYVNNESIKHKINNVLSKQETEFNNVKEFTQMIINCFE